MINCTTCDHCESLGFNCSMRLPFVDIKDIESCSNYVPKLMTNGDRIRAMTDEELAEHFALLFIDTREGVAYSTDEERWLDWLQEPYKGDTE